MQVKVRTELIAGMVRLTARASSLVDDDALLIAGLLVAGALGPSMLVVDEGSFKRKARKGRSEGEAVFYAEFSMHPRQVTPWHDFVIPTSGLAERLLGAVPAPEALRVPPLAALSGPRSLAGAAGEIEVLSHLIRAPMIDLFRPFPDLETAEILVRHEKSRRIAGVQVKTIEVGERNPHGTVLVSRQSFRPSATTWLVVIGWRRATGSFHPECLLVPTVDIPKVAYVEKANYELYFRPGSGKGSPLDSYRAPLSALADRLIALVS